MSYTFSRALVEAFSPASCSEIDAFAPSSTSPTPEPFSLPDRTTEHFRLSRFGMTCAPLTEDRGEALLRSFLAASRARTSAPQGGVMASTASAPACGAKWPASSVRYDPASSEWKTAHCLWEEVLPWSSVTLPAWGMTRSGSVYRHPTAERPISATGAGLWPTPNCIGFRSDGELAKLAKSAKDEREYLAMSDRACNSKRRRYWHTPTVCGNHNRKGASATSGDGLATVVTQRTWPTATATAHKGWSPNHNRAMTDDRLDYSVERESFQPGQQTPPMRLNPEWVEWLMGWPIGHTGLKPLETGRYHEWLRQHSPRYLDRKEVA